ncbi:MAG: CotH kinase family protein [Roseibacillus sp.]
MRSILVFLCFAASSAQGELYEQDFDVADTNNLGDGTAMAGDATVTGNVLRLTTNTNSNNAAFHVPALFGSADGWTVTFDFTISDPAGGNPPADGFAFSYGAIPSGTLSTLAEEGWPGIANVLSFEVDTWMVGDSEVGPAIAVDGSNVAFTNGDILGNGGSVTATATISWDPTTGASFSTTGLTTNANFSKIATPGFTGNNAYTFVFSARTGGANEEVAIDNLIINTIGNPDSDGDGLPNDWETANALDPNDDGTRGETSPGAKDGPYGALGDLDGDGISNIDEHDNGTLPNLADTDGDTLSDGEEAAGAGARPPTNPLLVDSDADGLDDPVETNTGIFIDANNTGTNPVVADTDGDGVSDGQEVASGRDPLVPEPVGDILITEFVASNNTSLADFEGDFPDWIEIYNNGTFSIDLAGWSLTDDAAAPGKWTFPSLILEPGEFLIVFASNKDLVAPELHTNFKLSAGGEYLAIIEPGGTVSHEYATEYPAQFTDVSHGVQMTSTVTDLVVEGAAGKYLVPSGGGLGTTWTGTSFVDTSWTSGTNGLGYDTTGTMSSLINTNIQGPLMGSNPGAYIRFPFNITGSPDVSSLQLNLNFDDGFVAYLNGTAICDSNAPASPLWNSTATAENSGGFTVGDWSAPEPSYALVNHSGTAAAILGGGNPYLRMIYSGVNGNHNSVHFDRTDIGAFSTVNVEFDFRMNGTADGFSFLMLPTSTYGTTSASSGATVSPAEEPNIGGVLAIGFDIWNNIDETSIHYGSPRAQNNRSASINFSTNQWHRAQITIEPSAGGGSDVSVSVLANGVGAPVVFHNKVNIPDLVPYEYRVQFSARTGGATTNVDLDNINIGASGVSGSLVASKDITQHKGLLQTGNNVLAVHGLNISTGDQDFLVRPELRAVKVNSVNPGTNFYYESPTPGAPNLSGTNGFAAPVEVSPAGITFATTVNVSMTSPTPGGVIRYTTNGTVPTETSTLYTGPIVLSASTRVRARAFIPNFSPSPTTSETYFRLSADLLSFSSDLPIVVIDNFGAGGFPGAGGSFQSMVMAVFDRQPRTGRAALTNAPELITRGGAHKRGSSTAGQSKPNLRIESWGEVDQEDVSIDLLDFPRESDFILYAPYHYDRSGARNPFIFELSRQLGQYAVRTRFVEVFANTGGGNLSYSSDYHGVYVLMEAVKRDDSRVDIVNIGPGDNTAPEVTGGYLWKIDRGSPSFSAGGQGSQVLEDPDASEITGAQDTYIKGYINSFGSALNGGNFTDPLLGYAPYIDCPSWIDHHMLNVLAFNVDAFRLSTYLHKDRNKPIMKGPIWDFDRSMESYDGRDNNPQTWGSTGGANFFQYGWFNRLFDDPDFAQKWIDRWCELRQPGREFSDAHMFAILDGYAAELNEAMPRNYARWTSVPPSNGGSVAGEIQNQKGWLALRAAWYDAQMAGEATFNVPGGTVASGTQITISPPAGTTVYYTTDGSDPRGNGGSFAGTLYTGPITITQSTHLVTRVYKASNPTSLFDSRWGCPVDAVYLVGVQPADASSLVISEVHYRPADVDAVEMGAGYSNRDDFEFIEVCNVSAQTINLVNCAFSDGIDFVFSITAEIGPGDYVVIARDLAAFNVRYATGGMNLVGGYAPTNLGNDGELVRLVDFNGVLISEFTYNDTWYRPTDGDGWSLELRDTATPLALLGDKASWGISCDFHGTPGYASVAFGQDYSIWQEAHFTPAELGDSAISGPIVDLDNDGLANLVEYALNLDPKVFDNSSKVPFASVVGGKLALTFDRWKKAVDITYDVQVTVDLINWTTVSNVESVVDNGNGTESVTISDDELLVNNERRFIRIRVTEL